MMNRSYRELVRLNTFEERFRYLSIAQRVGEATFGGHRWLNQWFYKLPEWLEVRDQVIIRDDGCDLGFTGRDITGQAIYVHHINPLSIEDIEEKSWKCFDPNNLICCSYNTHQAIHYGDESLLIKELTERRPNDTCPWK